MHELLRLDGLVAGHRGIPVVRDLALTVAAGEIVALLGPNGAGKSTTLRTISGLLPLIGGSITVLGRSSVGVSPHQVARWGVAHVLEERALFAQLTVEENIELGTRAPDAVARAVDHFPALQPLLRRRAGLLSGGEQQMLALARALVSQPQLLLIDEMSMGLAPVIVDRLLAVIRRVVDSTGCGVVLVEQHIAAALSIADRVHVLSHGELVASDTAASFAADPSRLTAGYLGHDR